MSRLILTRFPSGRFNHVLMKRLVSTSPKSNETATAAPSSEVKPTAAVVDTGKNWITYGYDKKSKSMDRTAAHSGLFGTITVCLVFGGFFLAYLPDYNLRDWATREAFLELRRREAANKPLIDPNLIDPAKLNLPSDEELGETEIII